MLFLFDSEIKFDGSTVATTCVPGRIHAEDTAEFHDAFVFGSMLVGTDAAGASIVKVWVVLPLIKSTFTCGVTVLVLFAFTKTRTHALRSFTNGMVGFG